MLRPCVNILFLLFIVFTNTVIGEDDEVLQNWPSWRGPLGNGSAPKAIPPTEWSEIKNVKWKICSAEKLNVPDNFFDFYSSSLWKNINTKIISNT